MLNESAMGGHRLESCRSSQSAVERQVAEVLLTRTGRRSNVRSGRRPVNAAYST